MGIWTTFSPEPVTKRPFFILRQGRGGRAGSNTILQIRPETSQFIALRDLLLGESLEVGFGSEWRGGRRYMSITRRQENGGVLTLSEPPHLPKESLLAGSLRQKWDTIAQRFRSNA
jgi:hypothetical protein